MDRRAVRSVVAIALLVIATMTGCAGKNPISGSSVVGPKGSTGLYVPGQDSPEARLKSIEAR